MNSPKTKRDVAYVILDDEAVQIMMKGEVDLAKGYKSTTGLLDYDLVGREIFTKYHHDTLLNDEDEDEE